MSALCAPIPDQSHISKHQLLHAIVAWAVPQGALEFLGGFTLEPRIGCQKILSEPLTRDMIQS